MKKEPLKRIGVDILKCSHCGSNHKAVEFSLIEKSPKDLCYWAFCPNDYYPILVRVKKTPKINLGIFADADFSNTREYNRLFEKYDQLPDYDFFEWKGDLSDDCTCEYHGYTLRAEQLADKIWWWAVYNSGDEIYGKNLDTVVDVSTGEEARLLCEIYCRKHISDNTEYPF